MEEQQQQEPEQTQLIEPDRFAEVVVRCLSCEAIATVTRTKSGSGFVILERQGVSIDAIFGISEGGFPICPNDNAEMRPLEKLATEAIAEVAAAAPAKVAEAVQEPLFEPPAFDLHLEFAAIIKQQERVTSKRAHWEELRSETKDAKEDLDAAAEMLEKLIARTAQSEREAQAAARRREHQITEAPSVEQQAADRDAMVKGDIPPEGGELKAGPMQLAEEVREEYGSLRAELCAILRKYGASDPVATSTAIADLGADAVGTLVFNSGIADAMQPLATAEIGIAIAAAAERFEQLAASVDTPELRSAEVAQAAEPQKKKRARKAVI